MNKEEYKKYAEEHEDWAPGWDAIDECFEKLYPGQEPEHFGTNIISRAMMGGDEYLDGYSIYTSPNGYKPTDGATHRDKAVARHRTNYIPTKKHWKTNLANGDTR